jgi:hypothetical protein
VKVRREQGAFRTQTRTRYPLRSVALVMLMALVFLLI